MINIFIVNLKKDTEKKEHMQKLSQKYNLQVEFIEAVDGRALYEEDIFKVYSSRMAIEEFGRELSRGEIGCALSHKKIYQRMVDDNISEAVVMEDDILFDKQLLSFLQGTTGLPKNAELVLLGYWHSGIENDETLISFRGHLSISDSSKLVRFIVNMHGTYGYYITLNGAEKLLKVLNEKIYMPIDHYTGDEKFINVYGAYPKVITLSDQFDIHSEVEFERNQIRIKSRNENKKNRRIKKILFHLGVLKIIQFIIQTYRNQRKKMIHIFRRVKKLKEYT